MVEAKCQSTIGKRVLMVYRDRVSEKVNLLFKINAVYHSTATVQGEIIKLLNLDMTLSGCSSLVKWADMVQGQLS